MDVGGDVAAAERTLDVVPVPQRDGRDGAREDREADTVRQRKVGREQDRLDLGEARLVEREVRVEDLLDVEAPEGRVVEVLWADKAGQRKEIASG